MGQRSLRKDSIWAIHFADSTGSRQYAVVVDFDVKVIALCCPSGSGMGSSDPCIPVAAYVFFAKHYVLRQTDFSFAGWVYGSLGTTIPTVGTSGK